jgi:hypothetical protein
VVGIPIGDGEGGEDAADAEMNETRDEPRGEGIGIQEEGSCAELLREVLNKDSKSRSRVRRCLHNLKGDLPLEADNADDILDTDGKDDDKQTVDRIHRSDDRMLEQLPHTFLSVPKEKWEQIPKKQAWERETLIMMW